MISTDAQNEEGSKSPTAAAAGTAVEIEILLSGVTFGPYTVKKVRERLAENLLSLTDSARTAEGEDWRPLQQVLEEMPSEVETETMVAPAPDSLATAEAHVGEEQHAAAFGDSVEESPSANPEPKEFAANRVPPPAIVGPPGRSTMVLPPQSPLVSPSRPVEGSPQTKLETGTGPLPASPRQTAGLARPGLRTNTGQMIRPNAGRPLTKTLGGIRSQILARTASQLPTIPRPSTASPAARSITSPLSLKPLRSSGALPSTKNRNTGLLADSSPVAGENPSITRPAELPDTTPPATQEFAEDEPTPDGGHSLEPIRAVPSDSLAQDTPLPAPKMAAFQPPIRATPEPNELRAPATLPKTWTAASLATSAVPASTKLTVPFPAATSLPPSAPALTKTPTGTPQFRLPGRFPTSRPKLDDAETSPEPSTSSPLSSTPPDQLPVAASPTAAAAHPLSEVEEQAPETFDAPELSAPASMPGDLPAPVESADEPVAPIDLPAPGTKLASGILPSLPAKPAEKRPAPSIDSILTVRLPARRTQVIKTQPGAPVVKGPEVKTPPEPSAAPPSSQNALSPFAITVPLVKPGPVAEGQNPPAPASSDPAPAAKPARPIAKAVNPIRRGMAKESALAATKLLDPSEKKASALPVTGERTQSLPIASMPPPPRGDLTPPTQVPTAAAKETPSASIATPLVETRRAALKQSRQRRRRQGIAIAVIGVIFLLIIAAGIYHFTASNRDVDKPLPAAQPTAPAPEKAPTDSSSDAQASTVNTPPAAVGVPAAPSDTNAVAPPEPTAAAPPSAPAAGAAPTNAAPAPDPAVPAAQPVDPKVQAHVTQGQADQAKGDLDGALGEFTQALLLDPKYAQGYSYRASVNQAKGDLNGAISDVNQLLTLHPSDANGFCQRGFLKQANKDSDGALADYSRAIELDPKSYVALYNRGMIEEQRGQPDPAIIDYNHALELNPHLAGAFYNRGNAKMDKSDFDGAIADYTNALFLNPKIALAACNRGLAQQDTGNFDAALTDYNKAISLNPNLAVAYYNRGLIEEQQDKLDACIDDSTKAIVLAPGDAQAYYNRGVALQAKGNLDAAANDLRKFGELAPKNAYADYARLYLWVITNLQNRKSEADQDLAASLDSNWNAEPAQLPSKIAAFLLGRVPEPDLLALASSPDPKKDQSQHCEVWYFDGIKKMLTGNKGAAIDSFHRCLGTNEKNFCEYILAEAQLHVLSPS